MKKNIFSLFRENIVGGSVNQKNKLREIIFFKNHAENEAGRLVPDLFQKTLIKAKQVVSKLVLIYFDRPRLRHTIKTKFVTFQTDDPEICSYMIFYKRSGTSFSNTFCA